MLWRGGSAGGGRPGSYGLEGFALVAVLVAAVVGGVGHTELEAVWTASVAGRN